MASTFSTDRELRALKPGPKWRDVKDLKQRNLILRVGPETGDGSHRRTWAMVTRFPGSTNPTRAAIGEYPSMSLEQARETVAEWRALIRRGIDPREGIKAEREANIRERDSRFGAVAEEYIRRHLGGQRRGSVAEAEIRKELIPIWRDKPIGDIKRADIVSLVETIADRPAPYQAHNVFGHIRGIFNWAIDRGKFDLDASPCDRLKPGRIIGEKKPRQRVLSDDEIAAFWQASGKLGYPYWPLFRLLMLTGQRKSEVSDARWREFHPELVRALRERKEGKKIDWSKMPADWKVWTVPPERFKSDASHLVPLSNDALDVLAELPFFAGRNAGDHLFTTTYGDKPVNGFSKAKQRLDREMLAILRDQAENTGQDAEAVELPPFVIHDIRRTVRTRLSALRISERIAEMVIGHGKKGLARVYDQHQFTDEMREALQLWAGRLRSIVEPAPENVVALEMRGAG